ncbi:MAG: tetratricopeptide repeat protein [Bacteroidia bacterium]
MNKIYFVLLLFVPFLLTAQSKKNQFYVDSLLTELPKAADDTHKVFLLDQISYTYSLINPDAGIKYGMEAKVLAERLGWKKGLAAAYADLGANYKSKSDHNQAIFNYVNSYKLYEDMGRKKSVAAVFSNLSAVYLEQSNYKEALKYAFEALKIKEELKDENNLGIVLENIGSIYLELQNYSKTMEYYNKALAQYKNNNNETGVARSLGNIGIVFDKRGDYASALKYQLKALHAKQNSGDKAAILNTYINIGNVYTHQQQYAKALEYYEKALDLSKEIGSKGNIAVNLGNMGEIFFIVAKENLHTKTRHPLIAGSREKCLELSYNYLSKAIEICKEINFNGPLIEFSEYLSKVHMLSGDHKKSIEAFEQHTKLKDSIFSYQNMIQFTNLEAKRELELKERDIIIRDKKLEIAALKAENAGKERIIFIAGIIILLFTGSMVYMRSRNRIRKQDNALNDISQLQSHYVRGPVARILGLMQIYNEDDLSDPLNKEVICHLKTATTELDEIVKKLITKTEVSS